MYLIKCLFNRFRVTGAVAVDISTVFDKVWNAGLLPKLTSYGISGQIFNLISSFLSTRQFWVVYAGLSLKKTLHLWLLHAKTTFYCYGVVVSAVVVSPNPPAGPFPRIKISFNLLGATIFTKCVRKMFQFN